MELFEKVQWQFILVYLKEALLFAMEVYEKSLTIHTLF